MLQPLQCVAPLQSLGRKIEQTECAAAGVTHHAALFLAAESAVENRRRNPHLSKLGRLILHQSDQRGNHDGGLLRHDCRQLIAEGLSSASRHHHAGIMTGQEASNDAFL